MSIGAGRPVSRSTWGKAGLTWTPAFLFLTGRTQLERVLGSCFPSFRGGNKEENVFLLSLGTSVT